jgi:hypothetical protein
VATRIELIPTLTHCVQTTAKQEFSRGLDEYLRKEEEDAALGERIELLRMFLESADFRELRRESEKHLMKGRTVRFILSLEDGVPRHQMIVDA